MSSFKDIEKAIGEALRKVGSREVMAEVGKEAAEMVRVRTRLGFGVKESLGEREKLKPLSDSTKQVRAGKIAFKKIRGKSIPFPPDLDENKAKLSEFTTANRSNLTMTGQYLESWKPISTQENKVVIGPTGTRKDGLTNQKLGEYLEENGRPHAYLTSIEYKRVIDSIRKRLTKIAQVVLTKL